MFYAEHKAVLLQSKMNKMLGHLFQSKGVEKVLILPLWESEYSEPRLTFYRWRKRKHEIYFFINTSTDKRDLWSQHVCLSLGQWSMEDPSGHFNLVTLFSFFKINVYCYVFFQIFMWLLYTHRYRIEWLEDYIGESNINVYIGWAVCQW